MFQFILLFWTHFLIDHICIKQGKYYHKQKERLMMTKLLLKNAKIYPITSKPVKNGDVLIKDGKIIKVGKTLQLRQMLK